MKRYIAGGTMKPVKTKDSDLSSAEICRANGWRRGTILVGKEGRSTDRVRITAVGDDCVLAVMIDEPRDFEGDFDITAREWKRADA